MSLLSKFSNIFGKSRKTLMSKCSVYKTKEKYILIPVVETDVGVLMDDFPIQILKTDVDHKSFCEALQVCLKNSRRIIKHPAQHERKDRQKKLLKAMKETSYKKLYLHSKAWSLKQKDENLLIVPYEYEEEYKALTQDKSKQVILENFRDRCNELLSILN